jgi:hypothetical protein
MLCIIFSDGENARRWFKVLPDDVANSVKDVEKRPGVEFKGVKMLTFCPVCLTTYHDMLFVDSLERFVESVIKSEYYVDHHT